MKIAIIAALPGELAPLVKRWQRVQTASSLTRKWTIRRGNHQWIAVCGGVGADAARRAFAEAETEGQLDRVISIGWAGALDRSVEAESIVRPSSVIDVQTGEMFDLCQGIPDTRLVTTVHVADAQEKLRLSQSYGAVAVDMEAAIVARLAAMRGIPVGAVKAISDGSDAVLPDLNRFLGHDGQMKMLPFLAHVAVRPKFWMPLINLGRHSAAGARAMRDTIEQWMEGIDAELADSNRSF